MNIKKQKFYLNDEFIYNIYMINLIVCGYGTDIYFIYILLTVLQ